MNHAWSACVIGVPVAATLGFHTPVTALPFTIIVAGYALAPDLDCSEATASRFLGPVSEVLSWVLRHLSAFVFRLTATPQDRPSSGVHRHATHTLCFAVITGAVANWTCTLSPWAVVGWLAFGALAGAAALSEWLLLVFAVCAFAPVVIERASVLSVLAAMRSWVGLAVILGCLIHCVGDAITVDGVPLLAPIPLGRRGRRRCWREIHLLPRVIRLHTGRRVERWLLHPLLISAAGMTCVLVWPGLHADVRHLIPAL